MRKLILSVIVIGMLLSTCSRRVGDACVKIVVNTVSDATGAGDTTYAVKSDGTVWSWGMNGWGQLGDGSNVYAVTYSSTPVQVKGLTNVIDLKAAGAPPMLSKATARFGLGGSMSGGNLATKATFMRINTAARQCRFLAWQTRTRQPAIYLSMPGWHTLLPPQSSLRSRRSTMAETALEACRK